MPNLRSSYGPAVSPDPYFAHPHSSRQLRYPEPVGPELGYGPEVDDRSDNYQPPVYGGGGPSQQSFSHRGGSLNYGGVYPIGNQGRGGRGGPPPSGPGYGYSKPPPKGYNERVSEDGGGEEEGAEGGDYGSEYDEYDEPAEGATPGGRQQQGGSNYGGNPEGNNYDYGDPVQNGNYKFSGQNQEGDEQGKDSGSHQYGSGGDESGGYGTGDEAGGYGNGEESDNHVYGSGSNNEAGREHEGGEGGTGYGGDSGSNYNSESGTGESSGNNFSASSSDTDGFDGFY